MADTTITISRTITADLAQPLIVNLTVGGTASFPSDYTVLGATTFTDTSASVTIPANQTSKTITLSSVPDNIFESNETVILTVMPTAGVSSGNGSITWTILNDDTLTYTAYLEFEGANNSTAIIDSTGLNAWTNNSGGAISTTQFYAGANSLLLNTVNGSVTSPYTSNLYFPSDFDWTGWINPTSVSGVNMAICGNAKGGQIDNSGIFLSITNGSLTLRHWVNGNAIASVAGVVSNQWQFFKATRRGNILNVYLNGTQGSPGATFGLVPTGLPFTIGNVPNNSGFSSNYQGYLDSLILQKL
jgi:Concanavalin A-like lectin/glucanases superfamily